MQGRERYWLSLGSLLPTSRVLCASSAETEMQSKENSQQAYLIFRTKWQESPGGKAPLWVCPVSWIKIALTRIGSWAMVHQDLGFQQSCKDRVVLAHWPPLGEAGKKLPASLSFYLGAPGLG